MKRWTCPKCSSGCNAPERMSADDVRRYCLACSAKTGRLVRRTCPAIERGIAKRANLRSERTVRRREVTKAREAVAETTHWTRCGIDVRELAAKIWAVLPRSDRKRSLPTIVLRSGSGVYSSGHANHGHRRIVLTLGVRLTPAALKALLLHELAHIARGPSREPHGLRFNRVMADAARTLWGVEMIKGRGYGPGRDLEAKLAAQQETRTAQ